MIGKSKAQLLIIDPQNSFCEPGLPPGMAEGADIGKYTRIPERGSLYVENAEKSMQRIADMIDRVGKRFVDIHASEDAHHKFSIFHPPFIVDKFNNHPGPYTGISHEDIANGNFRAYRTAYQKWLFDYTRDLEASNRFTHPIKHTIWPLHCLIGSRGSNIFPPLLKALDKWEDNPGIVNHVTKGSNYKVEHYSILRSEVPDPDDPGTLLNSDLIKIIQKADPLVVGGEASNFCVACTVLDICIEFGTAKNIVLLLDGMDPVPGFEYLYDEFIDKAKTLDVQFSTTTEIFT